MAEPPQHDQSQIDDTELAPADSYQYPVAHNASEGMPEEAAFSTDFQSEPEPPPTENSESPESYQSDTQETDGEIVSDSLYHEDQEGTAGVSHEASFSDDPQPTAEEFFAEKINESAHDQEKLTEHGVRNDLAPLDHGIIEDSNDVSDEEVDEKEERDEDEDEDKDGEKAVSFRNKRVLLIEDEKETTDIISKHLKRMGFGEITAASNATGALNQLAKDKELFPDIVLLELALIGMDGIQFLAQLRASKNKRIQNLPAVVITMLDSPSIYRRAARQKVGAFLRKPVSTESLRKGMHDALSGQIVEKPFSQPKSWLDDIDEEELRAKRDSVKAKASAKAQKLGFWGKLLDALIPWSGKA